MSATTPEDQRTHLVVDSPIGPLTLTAVDGSLTGLHMGEHTPVEDTTTAHDARPLTETAGQLREYFAGERTGFDLPIRMSGTEFQQRVWAALCDIPYGQTVSYGQLAQRIGRPGAARAVGLANGRNPVSIIVPCHRVIGSDGTLTGYGGGVQRKERLLAFERGATGLFGIL